MSEPTPTVLRETKMGQRGFVKEDVITYLDELNSKLVTLEEENKSLKENGSNDSQEVNKYKSQVENLQEKLNTSNNALRAAKKENEELQKTIAQLKAAGGAQANATSVAALEAAKKEIETLKEQLKAAEQKNTAAPQANAQTTAALEAAKKEIEDLRSRLKAAEAKAASAGAAAAAGVGNNDNGEINKLKQEITKISEELAAKNKEIAEKESKIADIAKKDEEIKSLNEQITKLKEENTQLRAAIREISPDLLPSKRGACASSQRRGKNGQFVKKSDDNGEV